MKRTIENITIELIQGDIASQNGMEAVVNAANAYLLPGGGVAGALHAKAGSELQEACKPLAPIKPSQAVITKGFNLDNTYVIHVLGPVFGINKPEDELLKKSYLNVLNLAEEQSIKSIAFPALSTGAFGYPMEDAAVIAINVVLNKLSTLSSIERIRFVLHDQHSLEIHETALKRLIDS